MIRNYKLACFTYISKIIRKNILSQIEIILDPTFFKKIIDTMKYIMHDLGMILCLMKYLKSLPKKKFEIHAGGEESPYG